MTAVVRKEGDKVVHGAEIRHIENEAAFLAAGYQFNAAQMGEVERQRRCWNAEHFPYQSGIEPLWSGLDEQAEYLEASFVTQRGETICGMYGFHLSSIVKTTSNVNPPDRTGHCRSIRQARQFLRLISLLTHFTPDTFWAVSATL